MKKFLVITALLLTTTYAQLYADYVLLHPISNNAARFYEYTPQGTFADKLASGQNRETQIRVPTTDTQISIEEQGRRVATYLSNGSLTRGILFGHSQGGLRERAYLQYAYNPTPSLSVYGLITSGSPNFGAPIIQNLPQKAAEWDNRAYAVFGPGSLGAAINLARGYLSFVRGIPGVTGVVEIPADINVNQPFSSAMKAVAQGLLGGEAGLTDMIPGSSFLNNRLNGQSCYWVLSGYWWYQVCNYGVTAGFRSIPATVYTASIIGTNNKLSNMAGGVTGLTGLFVNATVTTRNWYIVWNWFGQNNGLIDSANRLIDDFGNMDTTWAYQIVGGSEGDATVPKASQDIYNPFRVNRWNGATIGATPLGGTQGYYFEVYGTHGGDNDSLKKAGMINKIVDYQGYIGVKQSNRLVE